MTAGPRSRRPGPTVRTRVVEVTATGAVAHEDRLATEEPLEIRLATPEVPARRIAVTMRTPGHDFELATGWLVHERLLDPADLLGVRYCTDAELTDLEEFNVVTVEARRTGVLPPARLVNSACGVCGTDTVTDSLAGLAPPPFALVPLETVHRLPKLLREHQPGFGRTGGLHAAGLFTTSGEPVVVREDVGRHNALDKVVGARILDGQHRRGDVLALSGRIGFELVQKAAVSGIGALVAVGAPSSLAVALAEAAGIGLVGFTSPDRCVIYAGQERFGV